MPSGPSLISAGAPKSMSTLPSARMQAGRSARPPPPQPAALRMTVGGAGSAAGRGAPRAGVHTVRYQAGRQARQGVLAVAASACSQQHFSCSWVGRQTSYSIRAREGCLCRWAGVELTQPGFFVGRARGCGGQTRCFFWLAVGARCRGWLPPVPPLLVCNRRENAGHLPVPPMSPAPPPPRAWVNRLKGKGGGGRSSPPGCWCLLLPADQVGAAEVKPAAPLPRPCAGPKLKPPSNSGRRLPCYHCQISALLP